MYNHRMRCFGLLALGCVACGGDDAASGGAGPSFGQRDLASLTESCEGVAAMTGQALLDQKSTQITATLAYVTAAGGKVSPTDLSIDLTWPAVPVATCYPTYEHGGVVTGPRLGVAGVDMRFATADGKFDETLSATAWLPSVNGAAGLPVVVGVTHRSSLKGSWQPFPDYGAAGTTLTFVNRLSGAQSSQTGGNVGMSTGTVAELEAGVFASGFAMAIWPAPP